MMEDMVHHEECATAGEDVHLCGVNGVSLHYLGSHIAGGAKGVELLDTFRIYAESKIRDL